MIKVSFPSMGWGKIAFYSLLNSIPGVEAFYPPDVTSDIVKLGAQYSPEFVCLSFKVTLGEFINMAEKHGVSTFVQAVDCGPCRFGFYAPVQERIMKDLGYKIDIIPIAQGDLLDFKFLETFYRLSSVKGKIMRNFDVLICVRDFLTKCKLIEDIIRYEGIIRCREKRKGETTTTVKRLMRILHEENDIFKLHSFDKRIKEEFKKIEIDRNRTPLRVCVMGENHISLESFINMDIVQKLGEEGIEVYLANSLYDWITHKMHLNFHRKELAKISNEYIPLDIGGEAQWIIGEYIRKQEEGFDGFVHIYPFTCMPEVSARGILEGQSPDPFYMPIQFYSFDEHTGFEGMRTRIEAFIDLMQSNRENNPKFQLKYEEPPEIAEIYDLQIRSSNTLADFLENVTKPLIENLSFLQFFKK